MSLRVAILEPYYGGSHAAFVDALAEHSRLEIAVATLPARKWSWRMRGAAIWFTRDEPGWMFGQGDHPRPVDAILCNDMMAAADLRAMLPPVLRNVPIACYFHENQLTYPLSPDQRRDFQYGMTNITSALAADAVWFNSEFHRTDFLNAAADLLRKMPDFVPTEAISEIENKSAVIPPPVSVPVDPRRTPRPPGRPITILWPHRWEYDKNPEPFFSALLDLAKRNLPFKLVLLGEQFRTAPPAFQQVWEQLKPHVVHAGFLPQRRDYLAMIGRCDLVVSTAIQENFGIGVVEAILAGCQPLLPNRLAYPEVLPPEFHPACLFGEDRDLRPRLTQLVEGAGWLNASEADQLRTSIRRRFAAPEAVTRIDDAIEDLVARSTP